MTLFGYNKAGGTLDPVYIAGTADVDIKTLGGSLVPAGPLPVDIISGGVTGTQDVDIKTLGGSVVPAGPLPVDFAGTISATMGGTLDVDIKTIGGSVVASGPLPVDIDGADTTNEALQVTIRDNLFNYNASVKPMTSDNVASTMYSLETAAYNFGFDGTNWDRLRTTGALVGGTITTGLLATGITERNHYCPTPFFAGTAVGTATLYESAVVDVSRFFTKTICNYFAGTAGTLEIHASCCDTGTLYKYYEDTNIASNTFTTKSFTEAMHSVKVKVEVASANGTITSRMAMQT